MTLHTRYLWDATGRHLGQGEYPVEGPYPASSTTEAPPTPAHVWGGQGWVLPAEPAPVGAVVVTAMAVDAAHAVTTGIELPKGEVTTRRGAILEADVEIQAGGQVLPVTRVFRMPIIASDGREEILLAPFVAGKAKLQIPCDASGIWRVTEAAINRDLGATERLTFAGFTIYVGR